MKDIVIYGAGGFAREVAYLIDQINKEEKRWRLLGFVEDNIETKGKVLNGYPILGDIEWFYTQKNQINVAIAVGSPKGKRTIFEKLNKTKADILYPNLIHPGVSISQFNEIGNGNIICEGSILTCNIILKDFVIINLNCTIGHDTIIENYCTILPNVSISGNVHLMEGVDFGTNGTIIQGISVGEYVIIGAGAVVVKDLPAMCTAVGMPAKPIKFH
jgi:sugar O-acyltransferase (sialic acid O-acetyltransferase NeuD family)